MMSITQEGSASGSSDLKLMLVICYYLLLLCGNIAEFTPFGMNADSLILSTLNYFYSESRGLDPNIVLARGTLPDCS